MNRTASIMAIVTVIVAGAAVLITVLMMSGGAPKPAPVVTVTAAPTATAPRPVVFAVGSPEYQQLQACVFRAGYDGSYQGADANVPVVHFTAKGKLPEINFTVDASASPRTITPQAGRDTVLLQTAGCL